MKQRGNILPAWLQRSATAPRCREVAERLRRARRARRGAGRLRHLARPARRLRLRLLQLRDEPRRRAEVVGRPRVRAQARRVREDRGHPQPERHRRRDRPPDRRLRTPALHRLRERGPGGLLARRHRPDHRGSRPRRAPIPEAVLHLVDAGRAAPRGRRDDAHGPRGPRPPPAAAPRGRQRAPAPAAPGQLQRARPRRQAVQHAHLRALADRGADPAASARLRGAHRLAAGRRRPRRSGWSTPCAPPTSSRTRSSSSSPTTVGCRASTGSPATSSCPTTSRCASR